MLAGVPPNLPNNTAPSDIPQNLPYGTAPSDNSLAPARPRHSPPFANPPTHARSISHRTRPNPRRRSNQMEFEDQPSNPYAWPSPSREGLEGQNNRFLPMPHVESSLRESTSPTARTADDGAFRASRTRLEASPPSTRTQFVISRDELVANQHLPDTERYRVWTQRYHPQRVMPGQPDLPRASLDTDSTRPEPLDAEAMIIQMECKICFAQISNHALLPCGG